MPKNRHVHAATYGGTRKQQIHEQECCVITRWCRGMADLNTPAHADMLCCWDIAGMRTGVHMMSEDGTKSKQTFIGEPSEDGTILNRCHHAVTP